MQRLCLKLGLAGARITKQSRHLSYDHPSMKQIREWVSVTTASQEVDARLMCHFDQVWSLHCEPPSRVLWKDQANQGKLFDPKRKQKREQEMIRTIKEALGHGTSDLMQKKDTRPKEPCLNAQSTLLPLDNARLARTVTTLSWADGSMGRGYVTAPSKTIPDAVAEAMNEKLKGILYIARGHESKTHMWNGDTLSHYLTFLKEEFRRKRQSLGPPFAAKGMVLCDAATVHSTGMYDQIRARFEVEANCIFVHGGSSCLRDHGIQIVGGWGETGAPNDAWHQWYHYMRRGWMRLATGMAPSLKLRRAYDQMGLSIDGNARFTYLGLRWLEHRGA